MNVPEDAAGPFELESTGLGALPVIDRFLARIDLSGALERHLPGGDARTTLPAATAVGVLVRNLCVEREPLYGLTAKLSLGTQSAGGEQRVARLLSAHATCRLQHRPLHAYLTDAIAAHNRGDPVPLLT